MKDTRMEPCAASGERRAAKAVITWFRNHFDLAWRRCWQRSHEAGGARFAGYAELQRLIVRKYLELAGRGATFEIEQVLSVRDIRKQEPETFALLLEAARAGRFRMVGCGESIIDINQCHGETMIRNLASGTRFTKDVLGHHPVVAGRFDGFGASAQYPQIARGCGYRWVTGFSYAKPDNLYWRGLDGTTVFVANEDDFPGTAHFYDHCYYEPCPICGGSARRANGCPCPDCQETGLRLEAGTYPPREIASIPEGDFAVYSVRSEEMLPDTGLLEQVERSNAGRHPARMFWGTLTDLVPYFQNELVNVDSPPEGNVADAIEWNPTQTGTLVTRARLKRLARQAERAFFAAERYFALRALGGIQPPGDALEAIWLALPLLYFHDVITGTLCDPAAAEMEELARDTVNRVETLVKHPLFHPPTNGDSGFAFFNPDTSGFPVEVEVPDEFSTAACLMRASAKPVAVYPKVREEAFDVSFLKALHAGSSMRPKARRLAIVSEPCPLNIEHLETGAADDALEEVSGTITAASNRFFGIEWDEGGLTCIRDLASGEVVSMRTKWRPNALILEEDIGDPWGTRSFQRERTEIYHNTELAGVRRGTGFLELCFAGIFRENQTFARERDPGVFGLEWTQTVRLADESPRIDFVTEIYWKSANRRIRVAFPTPAESDDGWYGIPCGYLRRSRYEMTDNRLYSPNGDWPALDFFATCPGAVPGLVLMNRGAVSARVEDGVMLSSLLRSPAFGSCLERYAQDYPMPHAGVRDPGYHCFEYAVTSLRGEDELPAVAAHAGAYNAKPLCLPAGTATLPRLAILSRQVDVLALKPAFDRRGVILRLLNNNADPIEMEVEIPGTVLRAERCNLLEEAQESLEIARGRFWLCLRPWEIVTVRLH